MIPIVTVGESNSSVQLVGSTPQQTGRSTTVEEMADARPTAHVGPVHQCGSPPKSQVNVVSGGGSPSSSPDRGTFDSDGYSTASETTGYQHHHRGHRGSREKKRLAPVRLGMPVFKLTDPGAECTHSGILILMPSSSSMMKPVCTLIFLPVSAGTQVNEPAPSMKAKISP